ncbi:MAG TPA: cupin domain-containing protein [Steroidobacteraceae bacterium]
MKKLSVLFLLICAFQVNAARAELMRCTPDSPERQGLPGCSTLEDRPVPDLGQGPLFWHLDEFDSLEAAQRNTGPTSTALSAHGKYWLATVGPKSTNHHGGRHRADIGPLPVEGTGPRKMMIMSAYFLPEQITTIHVHSGPEAVFVVEGEQCMRLKHSAVRTKSGDYVIVPAGEVMQLSATGSGARRALVLVLHEADKPGTALVDDAPALESCLSS